MKKYFKWKKEKFSENSDMYVAKIPKINFLFYVYHNTEDNHTEATVFLNTDLTEDIMIKAGNFGPDKGKKYCECYLENFIKIIKKNF